MLEIGTIKTYLKGINFKFNEWIRKLMILRFFAIKFKVKAIDIERTTLR